MILRIFLDIMPNSYIIKNFSEYRFVEKPAEKLLEQVEVWNERLRFKTNYLTLMLRARSTTNLKPLPHRQPHTNLILNVNR